MTTHNLVCLSSHFFETFISQREAFSTLSLLGWAGFYSGSLAGLWLGLDLGFEMEILKNTYMGNTHGKISCSALSLTHTSSATWLMQIDVPMSTKGKSSGFIGLNSPDSGWFSRTALAFSCPQSKGKHNNYDQPKKETGWNTLIILAFGSAGEW